MTAKRVWEATAPDGKMLPTQIVRAPDGRLWVGDTFNARFAIFTADGKFVEYWGKSGSGAGEFNFVRSNGDACGGIAFAPDGSFFVLEAGNRRVQKFDKDRHLVKAWGEAGSEPGQYMGPTAIAMSPDGEVYVLDEIRGVIERYDLDGNIVGQMDPFGEHRHGMATTNTLFVDRRGDIYVSLIEPNEVVRLDRDGTLRQVYGAPDSGDGAFADQPGAMATDSEGRLFATQWRTPGVLVFDRDGAYLGGWGTAGEGSTDVGLPTAVLTDDDGNVYLGDGAAKRIRKFAVTIGS